VSLKEELNRLGRLKKPFLFIISYDQKKYDLIPLDLLPQDIKFEIDPKEQNTTRKQILQKEPISFDIYKKRFDDIQTHIKEGNTYLINLTAPTKIKTKDTLKNLYENAHARFKLFYKDQFITFSPERFCQIENNTIYTFPMKGTIDAKIPNAKEKILEDKKELAEHTMVVDLLRNDLSIVAKKVKVTKFRYCEEIKAGEKTLLQVSSKISGKLGVNWQKRLGEIITSLLPAGSITGAPKKKTVEILNTVEEYDRGYFTGVFGVFDGESLDSGVMIRFIQKEKNGNLVYKSGGGLTCDSDAQKEYEEMIQKVYLP
jgi:para-aminobenzoate synthetase component I